MNFRSTNNIGFVHFGGELIANAESNHGVHLQGGSTGGVVTAAGDNANIALSVAGKGTGAVRVGNSSSPALFGGASTTPVSLIQRRLIQFTVPALSSHASAASSQTITGLSTTDILLFQPRGELNSTVTGISLRVMCSTANSLRMLFSNMTESTLSGSTQSGYLLQIAF